MGRRVPTDARRLTAYQKVLALRAKAESVATAGYAEWADRLERQAFAIEQDYGGFDKERAAERDSQARARERRYQLDGLFAIVMDSEVKQKHPQLRAWASAAIDELKKGGPLLGEGHAPQRHKVEKPTQSRKALDTRKLRR